MYPVRPAVPADTHKIYALYQAVAAVPIGIARAPEEISLDYVSQFMQQAAGRGIQLVIENPADPEQIIAEIHCYRPIPGIFHHVFSELTVAVHPGFHGRGLGKQIFKYLLDFIVAHRPDILRVELFVQESNEKAIALYTKLGFVREGRFEKRIIGKHHVLEADIPMAWINPAHPLANNQP